MNYNKIYDDFIEDRIDKTVNEYSETHHILPKSLGGTNNKENLIRLSFRDHYFAHLLLYKIQTDNLSKYKMIKALHYMISDNRNNRIVNSRIFDSVKRFTKNKLTKFYSTQEGKELSLKRSRAGAKTRSSNIIFNFYHEICGKVICTAYELILKYPDQKLNSSNLIKVGNKERGRHKGWILYENINLDFNKIHKDKISKSTKGRIPWNKKTKKIK